MCSGLASVRAGVVVPEAWPASHSAANDTWPWEVPELFCGFPARRPQATASVPARSDSVSAFGQVIGVSLDTGVEPGSDENCSRRRGFDRGFVPQRENAIVLDHGCPP